MRPNSTAVKRHHGGMSGLVAQDLEHEVPGSINQERGESDLGSREKAASEGGSQSRTDSDLEISF
jgi:hypothetical protein